MTEEKERALIFARTGGAVLLHQTPQADLLRAVGEARLEKDESGLAVLIAELRRRAGPRVKKSVAVVEPPVIPSVLTEKDLRELCEALEIRFAYLSFKPAGRSWRATVAYRLEGRKLFFRAAWCSVKDQFVKSRGREEATKKLLTSPAELSLPRGASIYETLFEDVSAGIVIAAYDPHPEEFHLPGGLIRDQRKSKEGAPDRIMAKLNKTVWTVSRKVVGK